MPRPLLLILNPRQIPECIAAFESLPIDKVWLENYTELELVDVIPRVLAECEHDPIGVVSDDAAPDAAALAAVLEIVQPGIVATGYCTLDEQSTLVNLSREPLTTDAPLVEAYTFPDLAWVEAYPTDQMPTYFAGHSLTFMSRDHWVAYPWACHGEPPGCASDLSLSWRLQQDGVPIIAARGGYFRHVKATFNYLDDTPGRELLIGKEPSGVRWDMQSDAA